MNEEKTKRYFCEYHHDGFWWTLEIEAYDDNDARARAKRLGVQLKGPILFTVSHRFAPLVKLACKVRNFFASLFGRD